MLMRFACVASLFVAGMALTLSSTAAQSDTVRWRSALEETSGPTNGRANDQLRRNHSTQCISHPGFTWQRLRSESPGLYESYVDLATGEWTHVRIDMAGAHAALYVNRAAQPCLIVNDLKLSPAAGAVALWIDVGTQAYFRDLRVESRDR
jgi:hypothetical protein